VTTHTVTPGGCCCGGGGAGGACEYNVTLTLAWSGTADMFLYSRNLGTGLDTHGIPNPDVNKSLPGTGSPIVVVGDLQATNNFYQYWFNQETTTYSPVTPSVASIVVTNTGGTSILVNNTTVAPGGTWTGSLSDAGYGNGDTSTWVEGTFVHILCNAFVCCSGTSTSFSTLYSRVEGGGGNDEKLILDWDSDLDAWRGVATESNGSRLGAVVWCRGDDDLDYHITYGGRKPATGVTISNALEFSVRATSAVCEPLCILGGVGAGSVLARNPSDTNPTACCVNEIPTQLFATLTTTGCIACTDTEELSYYCAANQWHFIGAGGTEKPFCSPGGTYFWRVSLTCISGVWTVVLNLRNQPSGINCIGVTVHPVVVSCSPLHLTHSIHSVLNPCCPGLGGNLDVSLSITE
jgi:hypothetical protein